MRIGQVSRKPFVNQIEKMGLKVKKGEREAPSRESSISESDWLTKSSQKL